MSQQTLVLDFVELSDKKPDSIHFSPLQMRFVQQMFKLYPHVVFTNFKNSRYHIMFFLCRISHLEVSLVH